MQIPNPECTLITVNTQNPTITPPTPTPNSPTPPRRNPSTPPPSPPPCIPLSYINPTYKPPIHINAIRENRNRPVSMDETDEEDSNVPDTDVFLSNSIYLRNLTPPPTPPINIYRLGFRANTPDLSSQPPQLRIMQNRTPVYVSVITYAESEDDEIPVTERYTVVTHPSKNNSINVGKSMLVHLFINNVAATALIDPGADVNLMNPTFLAANPRLITKPIDIELTYANNETEVATRATCNNKINSGNADFTTTVDFVISPVSIPNVDVVLGNIFLDSVRALMAFGPIKTLHFQDGSTWHDANIQSHCYDTNMRIANGDEAAMFLKLAAVNNRRKTKKTSNKPTYGEVDAAVIYIRNDVDSNAGIPPEPDEVPIAPEGSDSFARPPRFYQIIQDNKILFRMTVPEPSEREKSDIIGEGMDIKIKPDALPAQMRAFPMSKGEQIIMQALIADLIEKGYVEPASPGVKWACPVMLLKKKGDRLGIPNQFRMVCDFRRVNKLTDMTSSAYTPPLIRDMFRMLGGAKVFSITDLVGGFYQLPLNPTSRDYSTIVVLTPDGPKKYRFKCVTLGLSGSPSYFQSVVEQVLHGIKGVLCYIDDFIIYSKTVEEHLDILEEVFARLRKHGLYLHPNKCTWLVKTVEFLGNKVSHDKILPADDKVEALRNYVSPHDTASCRRFLGFCQYLAHLIPHFNDRAAPISDLLIEPTVKNKFTNLKFIWTAACQASFETLRNDIINCVGLHMPSDNAKLCLETDASAMGVGACLYEIREGEDGKIFPLYFISKKFNKAERNYAPRELEALAIVFAFHKLRSFLMLVHFTIFSDHQSLEHFKNQPNLQKKDWRWQELMVGFDFDHKYRAGETMVVPDALSRCFGKNSEPDEIGVEDSIDALFSPSGAAGVCINAFNPTAESPQVVPIGTSQYNKPNSFKPLKFQPKPTANNFDFNNLKAQFAPTTNPNTTTTSISTPNPNIPKTISNIKPQTIASGYSGFDFTVNDKTLLEAISADSTHNQQFNYLLDDADNELPRFSTDVYGIKGAKQKSISLVSNDYDDDDDDELTLAFPNSQVHTNNPPQPLQQNTPNTNNNKNPNPNTVFFQSAPTTNTPGERQPPFLTTTIPNDRQPPILTTTIPDERQPPFLTTTTPDERQPPFLFPTTPGERQPPTLNTTTPNDRQPNFPTNPTLDDLTCSAAFFQSAPASQTLDDRQPQFSTTTTPNDRQPQFLNNTTLDDAQPPISNITTLDDPKNSAVFFKSTPPSKTFDDAQPQLTTTTTLDDQHLSNPFKFSASAPPFEPTFVCRQSPPNFRSTTTTNSIQ